MKGLWNNPEIVYHILKNSDDKVVKTNLAPFIINNMYCNYLSGNYLENNLLYIITLMLKDEIDKLESINQFETFLENTKCGFLLEELQKMPDVQIFFKNVIIKTVEKVERTCSFREIKLNVSERLKEFEKLKELEDKKSGKKNNNKVQEELYLSIINSKLYAPSINFSRDENNRKSKERNDMFVKRYVPNIDIKELEEKAKHSKKENKKDLSDFYNKLINDIKIDNNEDLYSNKELMNKMLITNYPTYILSFFENDFLDIIPFIEQIIEDLMNNILLLPSSIKNICKIISILVRNKFKDAIKIEENAFISKFLLGKLLIPIISFPSFNALISDFVISGNTLKNIKVINYIINKLFSGKLFKNNSLEYCYTIFNRFFLNKMENILSFYDKVTKANLPDFLEKLVNNKLPKDYSYDYFEENKEQIYANISICFNIKNLFHLINGMKNSPYLFNTNNEEINKLKISFERLDSDEARNEIKESDQKIINIQRESLKKNIKYKDKYQKIEIETYYLFNSEEFEKKYEYLFSINNKIGNFYIDIKKKENLKEKEKNIIKVKNYLCSSLVNYRLLNKSDFDMEEKNLNIIKILNDIKYYMSLPNFILNNNTIPSIWYINSILDYLNKIPEDYKKNNYKKLFNELIQNLKDAIKSLDFEILILFRNKLKFLDKINDYYNNAKQLITDISINEKIKYFVEEVYIPIDVCYKYEEKQKQFDLMKSILKEKAFEDKIIYEDQKKNIISFKTIEAFTRYFPNLSKYQVLQGINPLDIIKELSINKKLNDYFKIIKEKIKTIKKDKNEKDQIYEEKIKDYIMNKIYEKIYPPEPDDKDTKIFQKAIQLSWLEPNFFVNKDYIYDNLLPDILYEFNQINKVKSPYRKYICINNIIEYIKSLIKFNEGLDKENIGVEDVIPILNYIFIKAHPYGIYTDLEFIKSFSYNNGQNDFLIKQLESIYKLLLSYSPKSFNLTPEEYKKKCLETLNNNKNICEEYNKFY